MKKLYLFIISTFITSTFAIAGGACTPAVSNGSCTNAVVLISGAACTNGNTCGGTSTTGTSCMSGIYVDCTWYKFQATSTTMLINIDNISTNGCITGSSVFSGNGSSSSCGSLTQLDCESGGGLDDIWTYTTLTVGNWYYVQICYPAASGGCTNGGDDGNFNFCINVGEPDPLCNVCSTPCGTASGYATLPSIATVVADCQTSPFVPELQPSSTSTFCYDFQAYNRRIEN